MVGLMPRQVRGGVLFFQWHGEPLSQAAEGWVHDAEGRGLIGHCRLKNGNHWLTVETRQGTHNARVGDWVMRLENGELAVLTGSQYDHLFDTLPTFTVG
jgi:hypothetical protein